MDSEIVADPAYAFVADQLGVPITQIWGCCFAVWLVCYNRRSERLRIAEADRAARLTGFAEAMIATEELAFRDGDDVIFRGVAKRIGFLDKQAERGAKGGKASGNRRRKESNKTRSERFETAEAPPEANTLTPAPDLDQAPESDRAPARDTGTRRRQLALDLWREQEDLRRQIREEGIDPQARALMPSPDAEREVLARIDEATELGRSLDDAAADARHVLAVYAAEARAKRTLRHFDGNQWQAKRYRAALARTPDSVRDGVPPVRRPGEPEPLAPGVQRWQ